MNSNMFKFYKKFIKKVLRFLNLQKFSIKEWSDTTGNKLTVYEYELFYYYEFFGVETIIVLSIGTSLEPTLVSAGIMPKIF